MKISYSNFPILKALNNGSLNPLPIYPADAEFFTAQDDYNDKVNYFLNFKNNAKEFQGNINYIKKTFFQAFQKSQNKLNELLSDILIQDLDDVNVSGTFIYEDQVVMVKYKALKGSQDFESLIYVFNNIGVPLFYFIHSNLIDQWVFWKSNTIKIESVENNTISPDDYGDTQIRKFMLLEMFKTFSQVETKIIEPNSKKVDGKKKYVNDTRLPITHLDSLWFTNLVRSDGFKVSGHFRWQNKKNVEGKWVKDLIWINDFDKSGYSRKATKLNDKSFTNIPDRG